ncbi:hypothetical protein GB937_010005 [Aspergillus fischeri]|nr:hypothetical protein GB937_010005 [Aspergillus fischeri]
MTTGKSAGEWWPDLRSDGSSPRLSAIQLQTWSATHPSPSLFVDHAEPVQTASVVVIEDFPVAVGVWPEDSIADM